MISAGLPIVTALTVLEEQAANRRFRMIIAAVRTGIERGGTLSGEIAKHPQAFFEFYVNTVRSGEVSGVLDTSLNYLADYLEREYDLVQRVRTAATYPLVVLAFTLLVAGAAVLFIVPIFVQVFSSFRVALPLITRVMLQVSQGARAFWWIVVLALGVLVVAGSAARRTDSGQRIVDRIMLRVPLLGPMVLRLSLARFGRAMAVVIRSGIPLLEGLDAVADSLGNRVIGDAVAAARERMRQGKSMADALARSSLISPMVVQMIAVGEETGQVDTMLEKIAQFYDQEVEAAVDALTSLIEPLLIAVIGAAVGGAVVALYMPMFNIINLIK